MVEAFGQLYDTHIIEPTNATVTGSLAIINIALVEIIERTISRVHDITINAFSEVFSEECVKVPTLLIVLFFAVAILMTCFVNVP